MFLSKIASSTRTSTYYSIIIIIPDCPRRYGAVEGVHRTVSVCTEPAAGRKQKNARALAPLRTCVAAAVVLRCQCLRYAARYAATPSP